MEKTSFLTNNATPSAAVTTGFESTEDRLQQSLLSADRAATPSRRRPRASRACEMCRGRKSKVSLSLQCHRPPPTLVEGPLLLPMYTSDRQSSNALLNG